MEQIGRVLSPAAAQVALRSHWEAFQDSETIVSGVRPEIAASWRRSAASRLGSALMAAPVDQAALRGFDHSGPARQQFMAAATRMADDLVIELEDAVAAVVVCDDFGVVLYRAGRPEVLRRTDDVNLVPGGIWNERTAGTNGIGLALELGGSAHVYAAEHYIEALHGFSCTAAIVRHPVTREALGVLGLATDTSVSAAFARPLIVRAARDIERLLENQVFGRERELLEHYLRGRAGRPTPCLTVDRAGHTVIQNARMLQSASGEDVQLLLSVARHALSAGADTSEELELSRGRSQAEVRLVHAGDEVLGALVSLEPETRAGAHGSRSAYAPMQDWSPLVGRSPAMQRLFREAAKVAEQRMAVSIHGEPGTGKLSLAQLLHQTGGDGPLTLVHCAGETWEREWAQAVQARGTGTGTRPMLRPETYETLAAQPWPGNVRELHNALDAAALRGGSVIGVEALQLDARASHGAGTPTGNLREIEREAINAALERSGGNVSRAAKELGIGRATLHRRLRAYRLLT